MLRQVIKMTAQNLVLPFWYQLFARGTVEQGSVLFADAHHNTRPRNMEALYHAMRRDPEFHLSQMYLDFGSASFGKILLFSLRFMRRYARTQTVVLCDNFLPAASCRCRNETFVVQLWHACGALKKFGYDTPDDIPETYHGHVFRNTQLVTVSAPACIKPFASAMRLDERCVQAVGVSRTDVFFRKKWREAMQSRFFSLYPEAEGKRIVTIAPTFRGKAGNPDSLLLDTGALQRELGDAWFVLVSLHPHMKEQEACHVRISMMCTSELFPVTDVLVSDYSSLIYEYLLFAKPLVLYVPDRETYQDMRGFYTRLEDIPALSAASPTELVTIIREAYALYEVHSSEGKAKEEPDEFVQMEQRRTKFMQCYMNSCDGHSTERILKIIRKHSQRRRNPDELP